MILGDRNRKVCEEIQDSSYDVAIIMGGFAQSHLPVNSLYQVISFLIVLRKFLFYKKIIASLHILCNHNVIYSWPKDDSDLLGFKESTSQYCK